MTLLGAAAWAAGSFTIVFALAAIGAALAFFKGRRPAAIGAPLPPVTILKPLKGLERDLYRNLESFCLLDYPRLQLLFTLASPEDEALPVVSRLRQAHPALDIEIIVSKRRLGFNPKINNVANAEPYIKHDVLLFSDADIGVEPDFLKRLAAELENPQVGLVTAFYSSRAPSGLWAKLEALSVNADFLPQAAAAAACGMRFAMGAAMLVRREAFEAAGGFALMANHLADDFILGRGVQTAGYRVAIASCHAACSPGARGAREHLRHRARWARTIRLCAPRGYAGMALLHGFSLLSIKLAVFGPERGDLALMGAILGAKALSTCAISLILGRRQTLASVALIPLNEWLSFGAWLAGFRSSEVAWRGERCAIAPPPRPAAPALR